MNYHTAKEAIDALTRTVQNFPTPGVKFADLTEVMADKDAFHLLIKELSAGYEDVNTVAGIDARGFLLAAPVALTLGVGVLAVRKQGKLPPPVRSERYELEYGTNTVEIPYALDLTGHNVLIIDDVLATGGTALAARRLVERAGGTVIGFGAVIEIAGLGGREKVGVNVRVLDTR